MRNLKNGLPRTREHAYKCLIRPLLEYCGAVWDPHTINQREALESVQNKAVRYVVNQHRRWCKKTQRPCTSISSWKAKLQWEPLSLRRSRSSLRCLHKALAGHPAWSDIAEAISKAPFTGKSDHAQKLYLPRYETDVGRFSFLGRSIRQWNRLPGPVMATFPKEFSSVAVLIQDLV